MWKYEYREVSITWPEWAETCNRLGAEGWRFTFTRPDSRDPIIGCFERVLNNTALAKRAFALNEDRVRARLR